jgi:hypothetical protein
MNIAKENTVKGLLDAMRQVAGNMAGGVVPTFKEGLPNVYTGVCTMVMAFMFLLNRKIKLRDKIFSVVLLIFFMLSFILRQLDYIWHGFHFTNMIPYRFSFLFSFVMLYMAYRAWMNRGSIRLWQIPAALILSGGVVACNNLVQDPSLLKGSKAGESWLYLVFNVTVLLAVGAALWYGIRKKKIPEDAHESVVSWIKSENAARRVLSSRILLAIMAVELGLSMVNFGVNFAGTNVA